MTRLTRLQLRHACVFLAAIYVWGTPSAANAQTPLLFVEDFNHLLKDDKVKLDVDFRVEGRITSIAPNLLKLQQCSLVFRPAKGESFGKTPDNRHVVEVFGQMKIGGRKRVFVVENLAFRRDDASMYVLKKNAVRGDKPGDWYELGKWASRRASFYEDKVLRQLALEANQNGIALDRKQLGEVNPESLMILAKKASELGLPDSVRLEYLHEAHRLTWGKLRQAEHPRVQGLLADVKSQLPGAAERLPTPQPELEKKYRSHPLVIYRQANDKARQKLHRLFFTEVMLVSIANSAQREGKNGFDIADEIDKVLPEQHQLAEQHRDRELNDRLKRIDRLTRSEMLDLADRFRRRKQPAEAADTVKKWLKSTEIQLRREGPAGLMQVAEEYIDLLEDRERAVALLMEAYQLSPDSERIAERLTELDYRLHEGKWLPTAQIKNRPVDPIQRAIREGRVIAGMTAAQVRSSLGTATAFTRIASAGQVSELWIYGEANSTRITVHFLRRTPRSPLMAIRVAQVAP